MGIAAMLTKRSNYCCFAVSGKIELKSEIRCKAKNFTLAGQTAPGDGVCIIKNEINFGGSENFIIRHMRFRVGEKMRVERNIMLLVCGWKMRITL